jgi:AcrR family transcriptional regulator
MIDTKQKILDTAERLFAEQGYGTTSLRQVIAAAEVNVAAVHYHFGSKEELLDAVIIRKAGPVTAKRMALLAEAEAELVDGRPDLERVLASFLMPTAELAQVDPTFVRLMGRMLSEGMMPHLVERYFHESAMRFVGALSRAVPHLKKDELMWRVHFMLGSMAHTMSSQPILPGVKLNPDFSVRMRRLVKFLGAAFRAPGDSEEKK